MKCHFLALELDLENPVSYNEERQVLVIPSFMKRI